MARSVRSGRRQTARLAVLLLPVALTTPLLAGTALAKAKTATPVISAKPTTPTNATSATFAFTDTTSGAGFTCQLDAGAASACTSPKTYTGVAGGTHQFSVRAQATGKAPSNWVRASWTVDVTPPAVPTVSQPATPTSSTAVSITFSDSDPTTAGFNCSLDGATATACTSPFTASGLAETTHSLAVTARDALGNGATSTVNWVVDHTAPAVPVVVGPSSPSNATTASIAFSDSAPDVTSYTCALDGATAVACTSPWSIAGPLAEGSHTVVVSAIDGSGNATTGQTQWLVDVTAPSAPFIQAGPASPTNQTGADFTISDNDPSAILQCGLDGAAWTPCSSTVHEDVAAGSHSLSVRAIDAAGNTSASDAWSWVVDTTAPAPASFTGGPANPSNDIAPAFYFVATDSSANGFLCSLDGATYASCDSGDSFAVAGDGTHTLAVENVDAASNISSPTSYSWALDTTAPTSPVLTSAPADVTNATGTTFSFSEADSDATLACSLDGGAPSTCASTYQTGPLADGAHSFVLTATDLAGNASTVSDNWTIDTVAPAVPALDTSALPASPTTVQTLSLPVSDSEAAVTFTCAVDGGAAAACTSPFSLSDVADGTHSVAVRAVDAAGNVSDAASYTWTVDTTAPAAPSFVGATPAATSSTTVSIGFDDSEAGVTFACSLDGATPASCTSPFVASGLSEGSHTLRVTATDGAGNVSPLSSTSFVVDATAPPAPTFPASDATLTNTSSYGLAFSEADNGATTTCALDGGSPSACSSGVTFAGLSDGSHSVQVTATDAAGNSASATFGWVTDTTPPAVPTVSGIASTSTSRSAVAHLSDTSGDVAAYKCALDGAAAAACSDPVSLSNLTDGNHTLVVTAVDAAGNASSPSTTTWVVDASRPMATSVAPTTITGPVTINFSEPVVGVSTSTIALRVNGTTTNLATSLVCKSAATPVPCTGPVTSALLTTKSPLMPGQTYLPYVSSAVHDSAGNAVTVSVTSFRGALSQEENSVTALQAWKVVKTPAAYGGSFISEHRGNASVTYKFTGTSVTWYTVTGTDQGYADVYVDNVKKATVNNYASTRHYHVARTLSGFSNAQHSIKIVAENKRGSSSATNSYVSIDAVKVGSKMYNSPSPVLVTWSRVSATSASGKALARSDVNGAAASMTFRGTAVRWYTVTGADQGQAQVFIDGKLVSTVDNYATATKYGAYRSFTKLSDAVHTIKIVVLGKHHAGATGSLVSLDRFVVS